MKQTAKKIIFFSFLIISILSSYIVIAQEPGKLPDDPRVKTGNLPNGLSYIIIKNKAKNGIASFCVAQKCGYSVEKEGERGMSKILEPLLFTGTRNFNDSTVVKYLNSLGLNSNSIEFKTLPDVTTYTIRDLPISGKNTLDSALLILYNWMSGLNLDEEDVASELPFLKNAIADEWSSADKRLNYKELKFLYPRSPYISCQSPQDAISFQEFSSKELRNFYYKWYRPDLQAVIIVGDVDLSVVETQIKSIFATIPKSLKSQTRSFYNPKVFDGIKVCLLKDKEYNKTTVSIDFLSAPMPEKYRVTNLPYIENYMEESISKLFADRLNEGVKIKNLPISAVRIYSGRFMEMKNQNTYSISFETVPEAVYSSLSFVSSEINRLVKNGFTWQEFSAVKEIYFRKLEDLYNSRSNLSNDFYLDRALNNFFNGFSLASVEMKYEMMKSVLGSLSQAQMNNYAASLMGLKSNVLISCKMPEYKGIRQLSEERILTAYKDILTNSNITSGLKADVIIWPKFESVQERAKIVTDTEDPVTGSHIYILSNGATVIYKHIYNSKDTLSFRAIGKGGFSLMKGITKERGEFINSVLNLGGLGQISQPNMQRLYSYYNMNVNAHITLNTQELYGYSANDQIDKLFHAIYLNFTNRRADEGAFNAYKKEKLFSKLYMNLSPKDVFKDSVAFYNNSNVAYVKSLSLEEIQNIEYYPIMVECRKLFSNASDFTFTFAGNADEALVKDLVLKYIGAIPGDVNKRESWRVMPVYSAKGVVERHFLFNMEIPRTYGSITYSLNTDYTIENKVLTDLLGTYVKKALLSSMVSKIASSIEINHKLFYYPECLTQLTIDFVSSNENQKFIEKSIKEILKKLATSNISAQDFKDIVYRTASEHLFESKQTTYWLDAINERYMTGIDFMNNYNDVLKNISQQKLCSFARELLYKGNNISVIMEGTTKDVETENLLKNNKFIKDFFTL